MGTCGRSLLTVRRSLFSTRYCLFFRKVAAEKSWGERRVANQSTQASFRRYNLPSELLDNVPLDRCLSLRI